MSSLRRFSAVRNRISIGRRAGALARLCALVSLNLLALLSAGCERPQIGSDLPLTTLDLLPPTVSNQIELAIEMPTDATLWVEWTVPPVKTERARKRNERVPGAETVELWIQTAENATLVQQAELSENVLRVEDPEALAAFAQQRVLLRLVVKGVYPESIVWQQGELRGRGVAADWDIPPASGPDVVVYLVDALRADALGYAGSSVPTPEVDRLAAAGTVYLQALSSSSWTRPSVASLFSGLYPSSHKTVTRDEVLPEGVLTIAERFRLLGYQTVGVHSNGHVHAFVAFDQGFGVHYFPPEPWRRHETDRMGVRRHHAAPSVHEAVYEMLEEYRDPNRPLFLYVHTVDPHTPYGPPEWLLDQEAPVLEVSRKLLVEIQKNGPAPGQPEKLRRLYDGEVAYADQEFGKFWTALEQWVDPTDRVLLFTADHGEAFFEHDHLGHGIDLYEEEIRIPFLLWGPGRVPAGERHLTPVSIVDALPTLLGLAGSEAVSARNQPLQGVDLSRDWQPMNRPVMSEIHLRDELKQSLRKGPLKLVRRQVGDTSTLTLHDLSLDPGEGEDLVEGRTRTADAMYAELMRWHELVSQLEPPSGDSATPEMSEELIENLKALGYL